jgi:hypothetical protein
LIKKTREKANEKSLSASKECKHTKPCLQTNGKVARGFISFAQSKEQIPGCPPMCIQKI